MSCEVLDYWSMFVGYCLVVVLLLFCFNVCMLICGICCNWKFKYVVWMIECFNGCGCDNGS